MTPEVRDRIEQIRHGNVPDGYKKTKVGIAPVEWTEVRFRDLFSRLSRRNSENNTNVLTISAQHGLISQQDFFNKSIASEDKSNYFLLHKGEFAYNKSYSSGYPYGALKRLDMYEKGIVSPLYICFAALGKNKWPEFYAQWFEAGKMNSEIRAFAQEGARNHGLLNIAVDDFFNSYLLYPPLPEQQKIAEILTTQDNVIELKEKRLAEKQRQKKYLMQQLLTGKKRLRGFDSEWETAPIGKFLESRNTKQMPSDKAPLMAFVAGEGVTSKGDRYDRSHLVKDDTKKYKRTERNDFIYSSNNLDVGSIGLNKYGTAVISVVYEIFKAKEKVVPAVISEIIQLPRNLHHILSYRQGAFYGQYRIFAEDFLSVPIKVPCYEEQLAIDAVLDAADKEIELLRQDVEQEKQKKKALMQLLLTGIVRVNV